MSQTLAEIALELGKLLEAKQEAYGDSFGKSSQILEVLYPHGIAKEQYSDVLTMVRIIDKLFRVATYKSAFSESPFQDIAGYAILAVSKDQQVAEAQNYPINVPIDDPWAKKKS